MAGRPRAGGADGLRGDIAGLGDSPLGKRAQEPAIRFIKRRSAAEIAERRAAVAAAVREVAPVPIVNGGGTGSIQTTRAEDVVTEITAGSGFYAPTLFDRYSSFTLTPAAMFAMPVVRRPSRAVATLLGGGYPARARRGATACPHRTSRPDSVLTPSKAQARCRPVTGLGRRQPASGRERVLAPCEGRGAVRAFQHPVSGERRRDSRRGADLPRRRALRAVAPRARRRRPRWPWPARAGARERRRDHDRRPDGGLALHDADT